MSGIQITIFDAPDVKSVAVPIDDKWLDDFDESKYLNAPSENEIDILQYQWLSRFLTPILSVKPTVSTELSYDITVDKQRIYRHNVINISDFDTSTVSYFTNPGYDWILPTPNMALVNYWKNHFLSEFYTHPTIKYMNTSKKNTKSLRYGIQLALLHYAFYPIPYYPSLSNLRCNFKTRPSLPPIISWRVLNRVSDTKGSAKVTNKPSTILPSIDETVIQRFSAVNPEMFSFETDNPYALWLQLDAYKYLDNYKTAIDHGVTHKNVVTFLNAEELKKKERYQRIEYNLKSMAFQIDMQRKNSISLIRFKKPYLKLDSKQKGIIDTHIKTSNTRDEKIIAAINMILQSSFTYPKSPPPEFSLICEHWDFYAKNRNWDQVSTKYGMEEGQDIWCKLCGELIKNNIEIIVTQKPPEQEDRIYELIYREVQWIIVSNIQFLIPTDAKLITEMITNGIYRPVYDANIRLMKNKTLTIDSSIATTIYAYVYAMALLSHMIFTNKTIMKWKVENESTPSTNITVDSYEGGRRSAKNTSFSLHKVDRQDYSSFGIHTHNIKTAGGNSKFILHRLPKIDYFDVLESPNSEKSGGKMDKMESIISNILKFAFEKTLASKSAIISKIGLKPTDIRNILLVAYNWARSLKWSSKENVNIEGEAVVETLEYQNILKDATDKATDKDTNTANKQKIDIFAQYFELSIKHFVEYQDIVILPVIPFASERINLDNKYIEMRKLEHQIKMQAYAKYSLSYHKPQKMLTRNKPLLNLSRIYEDNGKVKKWDALVFEVMKLEEDRVQRAIHDYVGYARTGKYVVIPISKFIEMTKTAEHWDDLKFYRLVDLSTESNQELRWSTITDKSELIHKNLDDLDQYNSFFDYYTVRCPEGNLHETDSNSKEKTDSVCHKCKINLKTPRDNKSYYDKYLKTFEKQIIQDKVEPINLEYEIVTSFEETDLSEKHLDEFDQTMADKWMVEWQKYADYIKQIQFVNLGLTDRTLYEDIITGKKNPSAVFSSLPSNLQVYRSQRIDSHIRHIMLTMQQFQYLQPKEIDPNLPTIPASLKVAPPFIGFYDMLYVTKRNWKYSYNFLARLMIYIYGKSKDIFTYFTKWVFEQEKMFCKKEIAKTSLEKQEGADELEQQSNSIESSMSSDDESMVDPFSTEGMFDTAAGHVEDE